MSLSIGDMNETYNRDNNQDFKEFLPEPIPVTKQIWDEKTLPLVSISCITYNHENYIREAIEGFLMQKTTFPIEILIHDDASTDNTANIIHEYEAKYSQLIKPIFQKENQYSKRDGTIGRIQRGRAVGKYYATCEGDDYWVDPDKLQKQVEFLEANPDYTLCVGGFRKYNEETKEESNSVKVTKKAEITQNGYSFTLDDTKKGWMTKTLTALFINDPTISEQLKSYKSSRDVHLFYHLLKKGKGFYFTSIFGVYRIHAGGIHSMRQLELNIATAYRIYKELYQVNQDEYSRQLTLRRTLSLLNYTIYHKKKMNVGSLHLLREAMSLIVKPKEFMFLFAAFVPFKLKTTIRRLINR